ncbi:hypothetical protein [Nocardioides bruguierae]|uniref:hypothetical protein n=1 Tax=Nocardioides bruguierae TaxID=2945102 RepID=UPI00202144BD|nr:hypothetical protein [Nocardioides bruguierae]MCL8025532.1 hypothetical protein [Nocardioides bruguierae]MCL8027419.1 hypothetical protein [Nocardioides bruguierae]
MPDSERDKLAAPSLGRLLGRRRGADAAADEDAADEGAPGPGGTSGPDAATTEQPTLVQPAPEREPVAEARPQPVPQPDPQPEPAGPGRRERAGAALAAGLEGARGLSPAAVAPLAGLGSGAVMVALVALSSQGCRAALGSSSCGTGLGATLLVLALVAGVVAGGLLLRLVSAPQAVATALLGTGATAVVAVLLADRLPSPWLPLLLLVVSAVAYAGAQRLTEAAESA